MKSEVPITYNLDLNSFMSLSSQNTHTPAINYSFTNESDAPVSERLQEAGAKYSR